MTSHSTRHLLHGYAVTVSPTGLPNLPHRRSDHAQFVAVADDLQYSRPSLPPVYGATADEAKSNMADALFQWLGAAHAMGVSIPPPREAL